MKTPILTPSELILAKNELRIWVIKRGAQSKQQVATFISKINKP